jgi:hypothetical protein
MTLKFFACCLLFAAMSSCSAPPSNRAAARSVAAEPMRPAPTPPTRVTTGDLSDEDEPTDEQVWRAIADAMGRPGDLKDGVYTYVYPRDDIELTIQGNDVPAAAGIYSLFHFYRCACGRINVIGQFVLADYETNDVIDELRNGHLEVTAVGPLLLNERPRLMLVRFFGEMKRGGDLAGAVRSALDWTGPNRMPPRPADSLR